MECGVLATDRERHFKADDMRDLFENINMDDVLSFLREAEFVPKNIIDHYNLKYSMDHPINQPNIKSFFQITLCKTINLNNYNL